MEEKINLDLEDFSSEPFLDSLVKEFIEQDPAFLIGVFVALAVVIITVVLFKFLFSTKTKRSSVLLVGLCDSGKTLLFSRLLAGRFTNTQTSISENSANYKTKNEKGTTWTLVDLPGHESLRPQFLERFKASARAIVFVVDSAVFQKEVKDVAELLYSLLTDSVVTRNAPTLLIACNKQDITMAKSAKLIQQQLEKELNTLRMTRSAALTSQDGSDGTAVHLGKRGKDFDFSQLPMKVEFVECSARGSKGEDEDADIEALERSLAKL
ncbi:signal recognition particle receptor subunit beta [Astyanax mexicanus]|uniref:Signal recognition particle receptor subunit beta n=2 Tax=Astyanax mexicanus TaxID=7994 RepID=A0A8T2M9P6_ASTMX|nr:signal recognition particle receptor subunit beta [Astyanax mexicanus]KAG9278505.1 signal recognition particle receptor subunit beta [Astyanax mexicanus]